MVLASCSADSPACIASTHRREQIARVGSKHMTAQYFSLRVHQQFDEAGSFALGNGSLNILKSHASNGVFDALLLKLLFRLPT